MRYTPWLFSIVIASIVFARPATTQQTFFDEDFSSGLGAMFVDEVCGTGAGWGTLGTCTDSPSAPSPPQHARWGVFPGCGDYGDGEDVSALATPAIDVSHCAHYLALRFWYLLDFEESSSADRARAEAFLGGSRAFLANNGGEDPFASGCDGNFLPAIGGLVDDSTWRRVTLDLSTALPAATASLRFSGETVDGSQNAGQGFLIDDVEVECSAFGDAFPITDSATVLPALAAHPDGGFVAAWRSDDNGDIELRRYSGQGFAEETKTPGAGDLGSLPSVAVNGSGRLLVVWDVGDEIRGRLYDETTSPLGGSFAVNDLLSTGVAQPDVAALANESFVVAWTSDVSNGSDADGGIQARFVSSAGVPQGTDFQVNSTTSGSQQEPTAAARAGGGFVVAWTSDEDLDMELDPGVVRMQPFMASGATDGGEIVVADAADEYFSPDVTGLSAGGLALVWDSFTAFSGKTIEMRRYDAMLVPEAIETVGDSDSLTSPLPAVASTDDGQSFVSWAKSLSPAAEVVGRLYGAAGEPLTPVYSIAERDVDDGLADVAALEDGNFAVSFAEYPSGLTGLWVSVLFMNGFESGDVSGWGASVGAP